jgi:hypothetical protein
MPLDPPQAITCRLLRGKLHERAYNASVNPPVPQPRSQSGVAAVSCPIRISWGTQKVGLSDVYRVVSKARGSGDAAGWVLLGGIGRRMAPSEDMCSSPIRPYGRWLCHLYPFGTQVANRKTGGCYLSPGFFQCRIQSLTCQKLAMNCTPRILCPTEIDKVEPSLSVLALRHYSRLRRSPNLPGDIRHCRNTARRWAWHRAFVGQSRKCCRHDGYDHS